MSAIVPVAAMAGATIAAQRIFRRFSTAKGLKISSNFDSGNIEVVDATDAKNIQLKIKPEPFTEFTDKRSHFQWFYFRASNIKDVDAVFKIVNAGESSYPSAWPGYKVAYTYNPSAAKPEWFRVKETEYKDNQLIWNFKSKQDAVWFGYFAPYSYERHQSLIASASASPLAEVSTIGYSLEGRGIDLVKLGSGDKKVWIICRQHPGEHMAEWWADGFLRVLLAADAKEQPKALELLKDATVYLVPNMNPDGAINGHLRTNFKGSNLNREWPGAAQKYNGYKAPTEERSPEVACVLREMKKTKVDLFIDVHGDEEIPDNFFAGGQGIPKWDQRHEDLYVLLNWVVLQACDVFQVGRAYGSDESKDWACINCTPNTANMACASNYVCDYFDCAGATLEMPFKDVDVKRDEKHGWSPERCQSFGASFVPAIVNLLPHLRGELNEEGKKMLAKAKEETKAKGSAWYMEGKEEKKE